ncbi:MAG: DUF721 domain-containing protein [Alphaproteobacteria bacterium]|nr:DUF721 domain-containing protein [Alphaproteobacteria bacterium]
MSENFKIDPRSRTYEGLTPLTKEVNTLTRKVLGSHGFADVELISHWSDILGEELSQGVLPVRLSFPTGSRQNGTLHVRAAAGAFALLFEQQKMYICNRINSYFGYPAISQIKIIQGGMNVPKHEEESVDWPLDDAEVQTLLDKVNTIDDIELRQKTLEIGIALLQRKAQV